MEKLLNKRQVADLLGYTVAGITKMISDKRIPYIKMTEAKAGGVRFDPIEISRWLRSNERNSGE